MFDKTGTLTQGRPRVVSLAAAEGFAESEILRLAASLERASEHPLAAAIVAAAEERGCALAEPDEVEVRPGLGIGGTVDGRRVRVGDRRLVAAEAGEEAASGETVVRVEVDGAPAGVIVLADPLRPGAREAVAALAEMGVSAVLGDRRLARRCGGRRPANSASRRRTRKCCRRTNCGWWRRCGRKGGAWRWPATASMTLRRWRWPMSAWRWEREAARQ